VARARNRGADGISRRTYIYQDRATVGAGAATLDECALHLYATVVSRPTADRAIIDAGTKSLSSDLVAPEYGTGYGLLLDYPTR